MSHHDKDDHEDHHDDHDDHHDDHDDEHSDLHLELHRAADELGKYAIDLQITSKDGIPKEKVKKFIEDIMHTATMNCLNNGADIIGHTKSFLICSDGNIMSSLVDETKPVKMKDSVESETIWDAKFILHVIVHGIWDDRVRELTLEVLPGVCEKWDMPYEIIADYYDLEKSIDHHM